MRDVTPYVSLGPVIVSLVFLTGGLLAEEIRLLALSPVFMGLAWFYEFMRTK